MELQGRSHEEQSDHRCFTRPVFLPGWRLVSTPQRLVPVSQLVRSDLRACRRFWKDYGATRSYSGPEVRFWEVYL